MEFTKDFKVMGVGDKVEVNGLYAFNAVGRDGDAYSFFRKQRDWQRGQVVSPPIVLGGGIGWTVLDCYVARQMQLHYPFMVVMEAWGQEVATVNKVAFVSEYVENPHIKQRDVCPLEAFDDSEPEEAEANARVVNQMVRFCENSFIPDMFHESVYQLLVKAFSFHDRGCQGAFYYHHFCTAVSRFHFVESVINTMVDDDGMEDVRANVKTWMQRRLLGRVRRSMDVALRVRERDKSISQGPGDGDIHPASA